MSNYIWLFQAEEAAVEEAPIEEAAAEETTEEQPEKKKKTNIIKRLSQRGLKKLRKVGELTGLLPTLVMLCVYIKKFPRC